MCLNINIPDDAARTLQQSWGKDFDRRVLEAMLIEAYRRGDVSVGYLGRTLGMGVIEADRWLAQRGVPLNYGPADLANDLQTLQQVNPTGNWEKPAA